MMRWRSSEVDSQPPSASKRSSLDSDEPNTSTSPTSHPEQMDGVGTEGLTTSRSNADSFEEKKQDVNSSNDLDSGPAVGKSDAEPPDPDTTLARSADTVRAAAQDMVDDEDEEQEEDDDGVDHAEEEDEPPNIPWKPQNVQSTCEFTHTILDYAQKRESGCKKAEYSAVTTDELGNRWRLIVYVNGNGRASNHHLSLFLQVADADDLPFGWKKSVSYVLTLEHPSGGNRSYAKRNPDKTFKLCPKAIDWGWSQFITSDRIQQEGFVKADTLTVRAQVTVKSSSVEIDQEDAELYLKCAVEEGDAASVKLCLDQGASVNCQFKDDLYTPLHTACSSGTGAGSMDVLRLLLEEGADGNSCNKWRETPLLIAANNGHRAAVEALLKHGADPSLCSEAGWTALTFAAHKGYHDIVALLLKAGAPVNSPVTEDCSTPLHKACAGSKPGHLAAVKQLLEGGADVHALNKWRETPLLTAANHGQASSVEALLNYGADPCKCTDTGWSPLSIAAYKGHDEVVRILLEEGAPTEEDDPTLSALLQAATKGLPDTVELLLRHGADHTVTTKKGDTALSILVEQNLIDAAVEMVSEYNASIARCSRDRKKVQRARLLINLRVKQLEREGKGAGGSTDDEETDEDESTGPNMAQHEADSQSGGKSKSGKKKKAKSKISAEEKARAAEEALLLELEQEETQAKKEQAEATTKRAKKKKKKERERQQKMKEEQQRREQEAREAAERERIRKEKEEKQRIEREQRLKEEREREMKEMIEKEKIMAAKRKEREERERRTREQMQQSQRGGGSVSPVGSTSSSTDKRSNKAPKTKKAATDPTPNRKIVSPKPGKGPVVPLDGNRRWETTSKKNTSPKEAVKADVQGSAPKPGLPQAVPNTLASSSKTGSSIFLNPRPSQGKLPQHLSGLPAGNIGTLNNARPKSLGGPLIEHPAIALFRREKVTELLQQCTQTFNLVDELTARRVIYRWIVRASHDQAAFIDPIIPSWIDSDELIVYFQRQFIAESRRGAGNSVAGHPAMESLKEAGSSMALFCQNLAKQVLDFRQRIEAQLPQDWTDMALGMTASDGTLNGSGSVVTLSWANRAQILLPSFTFASLQNRFVGPATRFLTATFVAKTWYETSRLIVADTSMDFRLPPDTKASLSSEAAVSAELWSDPFTALSTNVFWGHFEEVDSLFGGQKPFGKDEHGSEEVVARHGGSVCVLPPSDNMVTAKYMQRMLDILEAANTANVPVSFATFLSGDCFHELPSGLAANALQMLDPRLDVQRGGFVSRVESLKAGQHVYYEGDGAGVPKICSSASLFVLLQNKAGRGRYDITDAAVARIIGTMSVNVSSPRDNPIPSSLPLAADFQARHSPLDPQAGYFDGLTPPLSPDPRRAVRTDFGAFGVSAMSNTFSPVSDTIPRHSVRGSGRGRLFDLVDNGEEEDVDVMSGMLNSLDLGLFGTNTASDNVDIEAISLMGIGGPQSRSLNSGNSRPGPLG